MDTETLDQAVVGDSQEGVEPSFLSSNALRQRIREIISEFLATPRPARPSDGDIMNEFLLFNVPRFAEINDRIVVLEDNLSLARSQQDKDKIIRKIAASRAERMELIASTASNEDFLSFRSKRRSRYNEMMLDYEQKAEMIKLLKPYLGMPHLPSICAKSFTAESILQALEGASQNAPVKGQIVLMLDENVYNKQQFFPRSAFRSGLSRLLFKKKTATLVRVPFNPMESMGVEAMSLGAFERKGKIFFKLNEGRPVAQAHWNEIDRFLPFACRSITVPLLPVLSPLPSGFDFEKTFGSDSWKTIEDEVLDRHGHACVVCGSDDRVKVAMRWRFREPIAESSGPGVQQLEGFMPLCHSCMDTLRPDVDSLLRKSRDGWVLSVSPEREGWLRVINRWDEPKDKAFVADAYLIAIEALRRRSLRNWIIDLSLVRSVYLSLEDKFYLDENGWIWPESSIPFKIVGTPFYEPRHCTRNFLPKPDIFDVPWGSSLETVMEKINKADMAVADSGGYGYVVDEAKNPVPPLAPAVVKKIDEIAKTEVESIEVDVSERPSVRQRNPLSEAVSNYKLEEEEGQGLSRGMSFDDDDDDDDDVVEKIDYN